MPIMDGLEACEKILQSYQTFEKSSIISLAGSYERQLPLLSARNDRASMRMKPRESANSFRRNSSEELKKSSCKKVKEEGIDKD